MPNFAALALLALLHTCAAYDVYFVAHSHCDVGWLLTPQQYFDYEVSHILDTVTEQLQAHPELKFHWAETAWLPMWLDAGNAEQKINTLSSLYARGQLEFLGGVFAVVRGVTPAALRYEDYLCLTTCEYLRVPGGWVQNDEAVSSFDAVIDQMTLGHAFLAKHFNASVNIGWQVRVVDFRYLFDAMSVRA